ncbi:permease prefix domain 1-containing protein [Streptomyces hoynatensis]|uniref:Uncharacterized protein n=1 Tax=Streptomyces hoynatensis TaxID=1141874 RepID=A0A3A9Z624_9ACTN|nr:permease prefix domain 1-containing protein [Streptomyces hoynatensis]RKN43758.1 hypothetical protein D7294_08490 [Streptomyces hoynatensis]
MSSADPVERHVTALSAALHGPARAKNRMLAEVRDGLADAVADRAGDGTPAERERAAREAVREFGTVEEVAPSFQRELTIAQARHTARRVALAAPLLLLCRQLVTTVPGGRPLSAAEVTAAHLGGAAALAALLAAAALAVTGGLGRRLPLPRGLPFAVAWAGTAAAVTLGLGALTLATAAALTGHLALAAVLALLTVAGHTRIAAAARACRHCARLARPPEPRPLA